MKILYLSLQPALNPEDVATGNQVRVQGLLEVLEHEGHDVLLLSPQPEGSVDDESKCYYKNRDELKTIIGQSDFDLILVGYWSLLAHLQETGVPVVLDFIAPRLLEQLFQKPEAIGRNARELIWLLSRADHFLVGNQRQADLFLTLILQAGFDCRYDIPVSIVPISARGKAVKTSPADFPLRIVNAGVDWPWRNTEQYRTALEGFASTNTDVIYSEMSGSYPGLNNVSFQYGSLLDYESMQQELLKCHIGMELGERNTEREFSHSFRALEYLECGLPVVINSWIPLAEHIRKYDAGWIVDEPAELINIIKALLKHPEQLEIKRQGVKNLTTHTLDYAVSAKPLLQYLENPVKAARFGVQKSAPEIKAEASALKKLEREALPQEVPFLKLILKNIFFTFFCPGRPQSLPDVLMVTRSDLFPVDHGAAVKIIKTAEALSRQGRDVWLTTDNRKEYYQFVDGEMITHKFPLLVRMLCLPRNIAYLRLLKKGFPLNNSFLYLPLTDISYIVRTVYLASRKPVGAYQAEFPAYVYPCRYARALFGGKVLLVQHNVEYERIKNQVDDLTAHNIQTLRDLEIRMCDQADNIVAVSENDRQMMINDSIDAHKIHTIPHGVDLRAFNETKAIDIRKVYGIPTHDRVLVYHGTYSYPPNLEAMKVMANEILPRLKQRNLSVTMLAIGSKPPDFPFNSDNLLFVGSVGNLAEVLPAADLAVVPLQKGGGTRMKIMDYFAAGVPVISTAKGIEGIPVTNGKEALIVDGYEEICDAIERLFESPEEADQLVDNASRFVDSLGWDAIVRRYLPLLH